MGYKAKKRIYVIRDWPDEDMEGLEVKARSVKLKKFVEMGSAMSGAKLTMSAENIEEGVDAVNDLLTMFADALVSWNLEDEDGTPVPATLDGLLDQDNEFAMRIVHTWMEIIAGAPAGLKKDLTNGETSQVESLPMEPLLQSQAS